MSQITIASTTDTTEQVAAAMGVEAKQPDEPQEGGEDTEDGEETPEDGEEPDAGEDGEGEEPEHPAEKPKRKGGWQRKIDKLSRELEAEREARKDFERRLADKKPAETAGADKPAQKPEPKAAEKPKLENFDGSYDEFVEALAEWKTEQRLAAEREQQTKERQQASATEKFLERVHSARSRYSDFDEVAASDVPVSPAMRDVILESEAGPDLMYYLGQHPEDARRIAGLPEIAAALELGKIEARIQPATEKKSPGAATTKAPAPITPVASGRSTSSATKDPDKMSFDEYKAWRARGGGR